MTPDELLEMLSGTIMPYARKTGHLKCDICFETVTPPTEVGIYASNVDVSSETRRPLRANVLFCDECNPKQIRIPRTGVVEIQMTADLIDEGGLPMLEIRASIRPAKHRTASFGNPPPCGRKLRESLFRPWKEARQPPLTSQRFSIRRAWTSRISSKKMARWISRGTRAQS